MVLLGGQRSGIMGIFFTLGYGARLLRPLLATPRAWRILDGIIAAVMWAIAVSLLWPSA